MANGVEDLPGISRFDIFPNPNGGRFTLLLEGAPQNELELTFTNVLGQQLLSETADFRSGHLAKEFSFGYLSAGTYILQVRSGEKTLFKKVVVE
ncbi:MAG: T9SS type A sorting domain-containing protein [Bacteroidetes bacterium]|nr:T9SS type A sorting domain-containing protein [Bacteroidota bacterium]